MNSNFEKSHQYDDIIHLPHHVSSSRAHMPVSDRAAQFSPFAALTGYGAAVEEAGRLTEERIELDEDVKTELDRKLEVLRRSAAQRPTVEVTYFRPDNKKEGGRYVTTAGPVRKIDEYERALVLEDGTRIPADEIVGLEWL